MKQSSLMRFFKPVAKEPAAEKVETIDPESPIKGKRKRESAIISDDESENRPAKPNLKQFECTIDSVSTPQKSKNELRTPMKSQIRPTPTGSASKTPKTPRTPLMKTPTAKTPSKVNANAQNERYAWLIDVKDANGLRPDHPDYDPRTLFIPSAAWSKFTPFETQYWEIKSVNFDTVVFFKKGKFYELYENDATIGHQQFDLKLTDRVNMRMVGVPESSFYYWASQFIAKGYKVAQVDQTENSVGKSIRDKDTPSKADKIIKRELTTVLTTGTLVDSGFLTSDNSTYCMAIKEVVTSNSVKFGIVFIDTATAEINISSFEDDQDRTRFETIMRAISPAELVLEKGEISKKSIKIIKGLRKVAINYLTPVVEFWSAEATMDEIANGKMFKSAQFENSNVQDSLPEALKAASDDKVALSALGGLLSYLRNVYS
jgi:DNA mismatch repair protein MSH6